MKKEEIDRMTATMSHDEKERAALLKEIKGFEKKIPGILERKQRWEIEEALDLACNISTREARLGMQRQPTNLSFFWARTGGGEGGGYYNIWRVSHDIGTIAQLVTKALYPQIFKNFFEKNNGWHSQ